jgi:uncharacterized protein (DUF433 family)
MASVSNQQAEVVRTERGLVIAGTRITLYQFIDYIHSGYPLQVIRQYFPQITDEQFEAAISYIEANRTEIEAEYQIVVKKNEEVRQYWEARNSEHFAQIAAMSSKPSKEAIRLKLAAWKAKIESSASE